MTFKQYSYGAFKKEIRLLLRERLKLKEKIRFHEKRIVSHEADIQRFKSVLEETEKALEGYLTKGKGGVL